MHGEVVIQQLEYLVALARERHFGRAASACHVSQPTLSVAIRKLEHELDVVIVLRGQRFEGFTTEGQRVVTWAHRILAERNELLADVERMRGGLTATARIGAGPTSVPTSPLVTSRFLERYPGASVRVESLSSREIARRLAEFELDAGLTYLDDETPPGTKRVELYRERFVLVAPSEHPLMQRSEVRWGEAAALPLCALTTAMRNRRILDANMTADGVQFKPVVETDTVGALYTHIKTMRMASVVAHTWLDAFGMPEGLAMRPMVEQGPGPAVGLIVLDREPNSLVAQALMDAAADAGRASP
jgi:DNA-binding transcriptional LysR family regulator